MTKSDTKQLALDALKKCLDEFGPEHDGTDFESECTECWTAKQAREAVAALEADIAQAVEPLFWYRPIGDDGLYEGPVHGQSIGGKMMRDEKPGEWKPLYTTPPEPAVNAELLEALKNMRRAYVNLMESGRDRIIFLGGECDPLDVMEAGDPNLRTSAAAIAKATGAAS